MGSFSKPDEVYAAFEEKVKRTIYLDNLSPEVTESVLRLALSQFGTVKNVHFIPNYLISEILFTCALVEMERSREAQAVVLTISQYPFMISGMPRPVRAFPAKPEMFDERPTKPGRRITLKWLDPSDPDFGVAQKMKNLTRKHAAQEGLVHKLLMEEEQKIAKRQEEVLKNSYTKYEATESVSADGSGRRLASYYNMRLFDD